MTLKANLSLNIKEYETLPSTNELARQHAIEGSPEGLVIVAEHQSEGRGQKGKVWESPTGKNLLFSLLLRPPVQPNKSAFMVQTVCSSIQKVLGSKYDIPCTLKVPNDILFEGKKISGVLVETISHSKDKFDSVVIGIGLNVNAEEKETIETGISMKMIKSQDFDRKKLLNELLSQIKDDFKVYYS